jgi:class 3 adenylate cyclase
LRAANPLQIRVGIATGLVVVGDLIGSGEAQESGIVGETPNLAARLQTIAEPNTVVIAEPNTVVIAESTRKLLGNLFELEDLGPRVAPPLSTVFRPVRVTYSHPESNSSRYKADIAQHLGAPVDVGAGAFDHVRRFAGGGSGLWDDGPRVGCLGPRQASSRT